MEKIKKIIFLLLVVPILLFGFNVQFASAADNSDLIAQLEQEIQGLLRQIIALLQQQMQAQISGTQPKIQTQMQNQPQTNSGSSTLTVNAFGVIAYVSINNGPQFAYISPITLNSGDAYSVTASLPGSSGNGNSTSKCSGTASSGGNYVCNVSMNNGYGY